jgi:decaprenyl-phosphate phosphoribosyltransferase
MKKPMIQPHTLTLFLSTLRPKQWIKNIIVSFAPLASGQFFDYFFEIFAAIASFVFASSLGYVVNDWLDRFADQKHVKKKNRAFASGQLNWIHFWLLVFICLLGTALPLLFLNSRFYLIILIYISMTFAYTFVIKRVPVLELIWLSLGFLVRALAGSFVIEGEPSGWFLVTIFFGALFIVSLKRKSELQKVFQENTRQVLSAYSIDFLTIIVSASLSTTIVTYCLWVFEVHPNSIFAKISILSLLFTILSYLRTSDQEDAESPETLWISSRFIVSGVVLTMLLLFAVFYYEQ